MDRYGAMEIFCNIRIIYIIGVTNGIILRNLSKQIVTLCNHFELVTVLWLARFLRLAYKTMEAKKDN